ncbi:type VII secretion protein EccB [Sanguibacter antarcticus]|uniref:Type VII secretion protein EccB n=1 Tax=Sanguibacter antarcticus TaxID=372484 RepID=A0A2A9E3M6_9MICO|nr:type VII secretion protein EccB [Sanguibacter antarcticus]PFG32800.1 type VII secretion protein EccB [Sanguibacter antarcticus]
MASKKELVEAQAFSRRRLLTAFVSGAPGGRELEPTKPLRAVVAGVALSVLLVLGSLGFGLLKPGLPTGWDDGSLVLTQGSGTRFVALEGTLYPVTNTTSARLLIPSDEFTVVEVPADTIAEVPRGAQVGIAGAPDELPARENLVADGWVSCTADGDAIRTEVTPGSAGATASESSAVVTSGKQTYVLHGAYRYLVAPGQSTAILRALGLESAEIVAVPGLWLNTFTPGSALEPLTLRGAGAPLDGPLETVGAVVGSVLVVAETGGTPKRYVVTTDDELAPLTEVAFQLYQLGSGSALAGPITVTSAEIRDLETTTALAPQTWPVEPSPALADGAPLCVTLDGSASPAASGRLADAPEDAAPSRSGLEVVVAPARGALVRGTGDQVPDRGTVQLLDGSGTTFAVPDSSTEVLAQLGYTTADIVPVPQAWLSLFPAGPELTVEAASQTPQVASAP